MCKYIGITIGPIVNTISKAKETGQLWGASYIFSYVMKSILIELINNENESERIDRGNIILPSPYLIHSRDGQCEATKEEQEKVKGVGLYPDRMIFESKDGSFKVLEKIVDKVLNQLCNDIFKEIESIYPNEEEKIREFIKGYLQISYIEREIENQKEIISEMNDTLDVIELQNKTNPYIKDDFILTLLSNKVIKKSFLTKDSYGRAVKRFESISEIALGEIYDTSKDSLFKDMWSELSEVSELVDEDYVKIDNHIKGLFDSNNRSSFKKNSKYIAIVQSDGDNVGKIIANLNTKQELQLFSTKLLKYSIEANEIIKSYGGKTIYAGGDDLLFFAPVIYNQYKVDKALEYKHIFKLLNKLDDLFKEIFKEEIAFIKSENRGKNEKTPLPGLSFGVSISYKSYPLKEALNSAIENLFVNAKSYKSKKNGEIVEKNAVSINVLKHSGQEFNFITNINEDGYKVFLKMLEISLQEDVVNSVLDKLRRDKHLLMDIGQDKDKISNYVNNFIREEYAACNEEYFVRLVELIYEVFTSNGDEKERAYSQLSSFIKFISFVKEGGL